MANDRRVLGADCHESLKPSYVALQAKLARRRIGSYPQGPLLVLANANPAVPTDNCFWVREKARRWYVGTWLPAIYEVPKSSNLPVICEAIFRSSWTAIYKIDQKLEKNLNLRRLSDSKITDGGFA